MAGRRPARRRARQETGDLYSGHMAVGKDVSYAPRQPVAAWVACTGGVAAEYGGDDIGRSARPGHGVRDTWRPGSGRGRRCDAREVHSAWSGGPKPAAACGTAAHGRPAWRLRRDVVRVGTRSGAGSAGPISLRPVQLQISLNF
jgi:hypothetical protein